MDKQILDFVVEQTHALMAAPSCSQEAKAAAQAWLNAVGTDQEAEETKKYIAELEGDIMPIDMLIQFAESDGGVQVSAKKRRKLLQPMPETFSLRALYIVIVRPVRRLLQFWKRKTACYNSI